MKNRLLNLLRVVVSLGALAFLFWKIAGPGETLQVLRDADLWYLAAAFLLFVLSLVVRAYRWAVLLRGLGIEVPFHRLVRLYFVGQFFSSFLPTQFGGDVMRALELTEDAESSAAVGTVLLDRMTGVITLFVMGLVALPFVAPEMERWLVLLVLGVTGGGIVVGALVLQGGILKRLTHWLPALVSLSGEGPLAKVYAAVTGSGSRALWGAMGVSVVFNLMNVLINWCCGQAVKAEIGLGPFFATTPILSISGLIPSIGGWGVREAVSTALFTPFGAHETITVALGLSLSGVTLAVGLVGGIVYGFEALRGLRAETGTEE